MPSIRSRCATTGTDPELQLLLELAPPPPPAAEPAPPPHDTAARASRSSATRTDLSASVADEPRTATADLDALRALPHPAGSGPSLAAHLDAVEARAHLDALQATGQRPRGPEGRRPAGVPAELWQLTRALRLEGLTSDDVAAFVLRGELPGVEGPPAIDGETRLAQLERRATHEGSWPAVNTLTVLIGARRSALVAQADALGAESPPELAAQLRALDAEYARGLQAVYAAAGAARERRLHDSHRRAVRLTLRAGALRDRGDTRAAEQLERRAASLRDRTAIFGYAEATHRARLGLDPTSMFALAAQAQVETGQALVLASSRGSGPRPQSPPAALGDDDGTHTTNGVPGAGAILRLAQGARPSVALLAVEAERQDVIASAHRLHLDRPSPGATASDATHHHRSYLHARVARADALGQQLATYGAPETLDGRAAHAASVVAQARLEVVDELKASLAAPAALELAREALRARVDGLRTAVPAARQAEAYAAGAASASTEAHAQAVAEDRPWLDGRTAGTAARDRAAIADAAVVAEADRRAAAATRDELGALEGALARGEAELAAIDTRMSGAREEAGLVLAALRQDPWPGAGRAGYTAAQQEGDRLATLTGRLLDRADAQGPADGERVVRRAALAVRWMEAGQLDLATRGPSAAPATLERFDTARAQLAAAESARASLSLRSDARAVATTAVIEARALLGEAEASHRPRETLAQLTEAERLGQTLEGPAADAARRRAGRAATGSLVALDGRVVEIAARGHHAPEAADALHALAHRSLDGDPAADPSVVSQLHAIDRQLALVGRTLARSRSQLVHGDAYARASTEALGRQEVALAQAQLPQLTTGAAFLVTLGLFDPRGRMQTLSERVVQSQVGAGGALTARYLAGQAQLAEGWAAAQDSGRAFELLHALQLATSPSAESARAGARTILEGLLPTGAGPEAWRTLLEVAAQGQVPALGGLRGPLSALTEDASTDPRRAAVTDDLHRDTIAAQQRAVAETAQGLAAIATVNAGLEAGLVAVLTRGRGLLAAPAQVGRAVHVGRAGQAFAQVGRRLADLRDAHRAMYAMTSNALIGGAAIGVGQLARRAFGASSGVAQAIEAMIGLIPLHAAALPLGASLRGAAVVAGLSYTTARLTPVVAEQLGWRSEGAQAAVGVAFSAALAGSLAHLGGPNARTIAAETAARLAKGRPDDVQQRVAQIVQRALERRPDEVPDLAASRALREQLATSLGLTGRPQDAKAQATVDATVDVLIAGRAAALALGPRGSVVDADAARAAVERTAEALLVARGAGAERAPAYADAELAVRVRLVEAHGGSGPVLDAARTRGLAAELADTIPRLPPAQRARAERALALELDNVERALAVGSEAGLRERPGGRASVHEAARDRLQRDAGLSAAEALVVMQHIEQRALGAAIQDRLRRQQEPSTVPLGPEDHAAIAAELAQRTGSPEATLRTAVERAAASPPFAYWARQHRAERHRALQRQWTAALKALPDTAAAALTMLSTRQRRAVFGDGPPPVVALSLAALPGFTKLCQDAPDRARLLVEAAGLFRVDQGAKSADAIIRAAIQRSASPAEGYAAAAAELAPMMPVVTPHPTLRDHVVVRRGPRSPAWVPALRIVATGPLDHNGAFHLRVIKAENEGNAIPCAPTDDTPEKHVPVRSAFLDHRTARPEQLSVGGRPLTSMDQVMVYSGHGNRDGIGGLDPRQVARTIADQVGGADIRVVVLDACHQRNGLWTPSTGQRIQAELSAIRAARGQPPLEVFAVATAGTTTGADDHLSGGLQQTRPLLGLAKDRAHVHARLLPADHRRVDVSTENVKRALTLLGDTAREGIESSRRFVVVPVLPPHAGTVQDDDPVRRAPVAAH